MKLVEMKCKNCGSTLKVEENAQSITCEYCHSTFMIDDEGKEAFEKIADTIESTHKSQNKIAIISSLIAVVLLLYLCVSSFILDLSSCLTIPSSVIAVQRQNYLLKV